MNIKAYKMDGLGNDFVIIDQRDKIIEFSKKEIIKICDRNFIGCDQLIVIKKNKELDASLEFFNSDGSTSGACGNGTRCVAYLLSKEMNKNKIILGTESGNLESKILEKKLIETKIGPAKTNWDEIPLIKELDTSSLNFKVTDKNNNHHLLSGMAVNVGNPHIVFFLNDMLDYFDLEEFDLEKIGPYIENNKLFPKKCNVTFANAINENLIKIKVWERGAGLTKACGTAACATAVAGNIKGYVKEKIDIEFELGKLSIFIDEKNNIHMKGPVSEIKEIEIKL